MMKLKLRMLILNVIWFLSVAKHRLHAGKSYIFLGIEEKEPTLLSCDQQVHWQKMNHISQSFQLAKIKWGKFDLLRSGSPTCWVGCRGMILCEIGILPISVMGTLELIEQTGQENRLNNYLFLLNRYILRTWTFFGKELLIGFFFLHAVL